MAAVPPPIKTVNKKSQNPFHGLKWYEGLVSCFPLVLVLLGGAFGGIFGAVGMSLSLMAFRSKLVLPVKWSLSVAAFSGAIFFWLLALLILASL